MGKSPGAGPPAVAVKDFSGELADLQTQLASNTQRLTDFQSTPPGFAGPEVPGVESVAAIDFEAAAADAGNKAKSDFDAEAATKKGRSGTILTNPLLDDVDPTTTDTLLS